MTLGAWWWISGDTRNPPITQRGPNSRIDYFMENFTAQFIQPDGRAPYLLRATYTSHDPIEGVTLLEQPQLEMQQAGQARWRVTAGTGVITEDDDIILTSGVNTVREALDDLSPLQAYTQQLTVNPRTGSANTEEPVTIFSAQATVDAVGMQIFFHEQRLKLLHNVHTRYAP